MANTVILVLISLVMLPILYLKFWYPALLQDVIESSMDTVVSCPLGQGWLLAGNANSPNQTEVNFPSITVFQRAD